MMSRSHFMKAAAAGEIDVLQPMMERVELRRGQVLYEPGDVVGAMYFPESCVISLLQTFSDGTTVESSTVGCEGFICLAAALEPNGSRASMRQFVQVGGNALRISSTDFARAFSDLPAFKSLVLRFSSGFISSALLQVACNRAHNVEKRLARWLLMTRDRSTEDAMPLTHDILGEMLGVHRPTVTVALRDLRAAGLIDSRPGQITIIDRDGLEAVACECYGLAVRVLPSSC